MYLFRKAEKLEEKKRRNMLERRICDFATHDVTNVFIRILEKALTLIKLPDLQDEHLATLLNRLCELCRNAPCISVMMCPMETDVEKCHGQKVQF